ncbi:hypothetical protein [Dyella sp. EPa41]|uniref:hypothetical protein n=1 Tax=Dyella sp. EPa41 TaxID=1561194 RepID=UPI001915B75B|nr:hypothetical protein [Dyella sp. EPa41]
MTCRLFRHLRRCRALFALALCAWLALATVAWAQPGDCCAPMASSMDRCMPHAPAPHDHGAPHSLGVATDGCCAHASISVPPPAWGAMSQAEPARQDWRAHRETAPQPVYEPPLRPPVA